MIPVPYQFLYLHWGILHKKIHNVHSSFSRQSWDDSLYNNHFFPTAVHSEDSSDHGSQLPHYSKGCLFPQGLTIEGERWENKNEGTCSVSRSKLTAVQLASYLTDLADRCIWSDSLEKAFILVSAALFLLGGLAEGYRTSASMNAVVSSTCPGKPRKIFAHLSERRSPSVQPVPKINSCELKKKKKPKKGKEIQGK